MMYLFKGGKKNISIHSLRGEGDNKDQFNLAVDRDISIHSLRGEGDVWLICNLFILKIKNFNPLPPWGGRRCRRSDLFYH